jgi:hypothetical protein
VPDLIFAAPEACPVWHDRGIAVGNGVFEMVGNII